MGGVVVKVFSVAGRMCAEHREEEHDVFEEVKAVKYNWGLSWGQKGLEKGL